MVIIFLIIGLFLFGLLVGSRILTELSTSKAFTETTQGQAALQSAENTMYALDYSFPLILIGLLIAVVFGALSIKAHPIFFIPTLLILVLVIIVAAPMSNIFMGFAVNEGLSTETAKYDFGTLIVGNFPLIAAIFGLIIMLALFAKPRDGGGGA